MKSHTYYIVEVKEHTDNNYEASCNVGNGKATVLSSSFEDAIKLAVNNAFEIKPHKELA